MSQSPQLRQVAALPWRRRKEGIEVLLVTSRETKRWVIPKGWAMTGLTEHAAAAQEAFEEAGVAGVVAPTPLGHFDYDKAQSTGKRLRIRADVYALEVVEEHKRWPERDERKRKWFSAEDAAPLVAEDELATIIRAVAAW